MPLLRSTLVSIADEAMHVMLVTDAEGVILWREGAARLLHAADGVGLCPGHPVERGGHRHQRDGHHAGRRRPGADPLGRAPGAHLPRLDLRRGARCTTRTPAPSSGAIDISGPLHTVHPAMVQLVSATAQLAENQLRVRLAIADERLRVRNMPHLTSLRGQAGALVTPSGRIIAGEPYGDWPDRVELPAGADRVRLADGREMVVEPLAEGYLLRLACSRPRRRPGAARCRCGSWATGAPTAVLNGTADPAHPAARPSCSPRWPCTPRG